MPIASILSALTRRRPRPASDPHAHTSSKAARERAEYERDAARGRILPF